MTDRPTPPARTAYEWRLTYDRGDLQHYTEWTQQFPVVENQYDQLRRQADTSGVRLQRRPRKPDESDDTGRDDPDSALVVGGQP